MSPTEAGRARTPWPTIYFRLEAAGSERVSVVGDFNGWDPDKHALHRSPNGVWLCQVPLPPGRYRYAFLVDGVRRLDPGCAAHDRTDDGQDCCVVEAA